MLILVTYEIIEHHHPKSFLFLGEEPYCRTFCEVE